VVFLVLLLAAELILITPMFLVWRRLKALFPRMAKDLEDWVEFIKSVVFNGLALGIFASLFPIWRAPGAFPLLVLVLACWLTLPACAFSNFCKRIYPTVRGVQLLLLFGLLVLEMAFPRQMEQRGWATGRGIGNVLSVNQKEITSEWSTMKWFNNAGEPVVWYSGSSADGYRLWAAPGFDPASGQQLKPVLDDKTERQITAELLEAERKLRERAAGEALVSTRRNAEDQSRAKATRYLTDPLLIQYSGQRELLVAVQSAEMGLDSILSTALANQLNHSGISTDALAFKDAFAKDGLLDSLFSGDVSVAEALNLAKRARFVLLAKQSTTDTTNAELGGIISSKVAFHARLISIPTGKAVDEIQELSSGADFTKELAYAMARERLIKKLSSKNWKPALESK
jgi:hypothetical protein